MLRPILAVLMLLPLPAAADVTFRFYGADNCGPCQAFKRDHLASVRAVAADDGFVVAEHLIPDLRRMGEAGVYGAADLALRAALAGGRAYPPIFVVTDGDRVLSMHGADWGAALVAARDAE